MRKIEQLLTTKISEITPHYLRGIRQELEQGSQIDTELLSKLNTYLEQMLSVYANYLDTLKQQEMEYQNQQQKQLCTIYMKESDLKWITDRKNRSASNQKQFLKKDLVCYLPWPFVKQHTKSIKPSEKSLHSISSVPVLAGMIEAKDAYRMLYKKEKLSKTVRSHIPVLEYEISIGEAIQFIRIPQGQNEVKLSILKRQSFETAKLTQKMLQDIYEKTLYLLRKKHVLDDLSFEPISRRSEIDSDHFPVLRTQLQIIHDTFSGTKSNLESMPNQQLENYFKDILDLISRDMETILKSDFREFPIDKLQYVKEILGYVSMIPFTEEQTALFRMYYLQTHKVILEWKRIYTKEKVTQDETLKRFKNALYELYNLLGKIVRKQKWSKKEALFVESGEKSHFIKEFMVSNPPQRLPYFQLLTYLRILKENLLDHYHYEEQNNSYFKQAFIQIQYSVSNQSDLIDSEMIANLKKIYKLLQDTQIPELQKNKIKKYLSPLENIISCSQLQLQEREEILLKRKAGQMIADMILKQHIEVPIVQDFLEKNPYLYQDLEQRLFLACSEAYQESLLASYDPKLEQIIRENMELSAYYAAILELLMKLKTPYIPFPKQLLQQMTERLKGSDKSVALAKEGMQLLLQALQKDSIPTILEGYQYSFHLPLEIKYLKETKTNKWSEPPTIPVIEDQLVHYGYTIREIPEGYLLSAYDVSQIKGSGSCPSKLIKITKTGQILFLSESFSMVEIQKSILPFQIDRLSTMDESTSYQLKLLQEATAIIRENVLLSNRFQIEAAFPEIRLYLLQLQGYHILPKQLLSSQDEILEDGEYGYSFTVNKNGNRILGIHHFVEDQTQSPFGYRKAQSTFLAIDQANQITFLDEHPCYVQIKAVLSNISAYEMDTIPQFSYLLQQLNQLDTVISSEIGEFTLGLNNRYSNLITYAELVKVRRYLCQRTPFQVTKSSSITSNYVKKLTRYFESTIH